jgi:hypothetical protein
MPWHIRSLRKDEAAGASRVSTRPATFGYFWWCKSNGKRMVIKGGVVSGDTARAGRRGGGKGFKVMLF